MREHQDQHHHGKERHMAQHVQFLTHVGRIDGIEISAQNDGGNDRQEEQIGQRVGQASWPVACPVFPIRRMRLIGREACPTWQYDVPQAYGERERGQADNVIPVKFDRAAAANQVR
jgi:hypothetical protein